MRHTAPETYDFPIAETGETKQIRFRANRYADNGTLAVTMESKARWADSEYWEPYGVLTVNLPDSDRLADSTKAFVDINNFGSGIVAWLEHEGIATCTSILGESGYCMYPLMEFSEGFVAGVATREYLEYED